MLPRAVFTLLLFIILVANGALPAQACTSLRVKTTDGGIFYARTMEFPTSPKAVVAIFPKGTPMRGTLPDGNQGGLSWTAKYGFVGMRDFAPPIVSDGMNEKGLVVGMLLFPGFAGYQPYDSALASKTIANFEMANWMLANYATVDEVREGLKGIRVCEAPLPLPGGTMLFTMPQAAAL